MKYFVLITYVATYVISNLYLFPCNHLILFLYYSSNFITSVTVMFTLHMIAEKWVHFTPIKICFLIVTRSVLSTHFVFQEIRI